MKIVIHRATRHVFVHRAATTRDAPFNAMRRVADAMGALIGGEHRPEGRHAKNTPITADAEYTARRVSGGWIVTRGDGKRLEIDSDCTEAEALSFAKIATIGWR